jgi:FMN-dependent NADH-azoreductase
MKRILHIIASPREEESRTLRLAEAFFEGFEPSHPDWVVDTLDLFAEDLPQLAMKRVDGRYVLLSGKGIHGRLKEAWEEVLAHIERFSTADAFAVTAPMWNFSIPYILKHYIDIIVQPNLTFRYRPGGGVEGLVAGRRMAFLTTRGGTYDDPESKEMDFQEPYVRRIMGFIGVREVTFVIAQPLDGVSAEERRRTLAQATAAARALGARF